MGFHTLNGKEFVGLRSTFSGGRQVVYDAGTGKRFVFDIRNESATDEDINSALKEGIIARNVLCGVFAALSARKIDIDFVL